MSTLAGQMSEADLLGAVLELARWAGWRSFHARPARIIDGWRTAVQGDGAGFPDLLAVRHDRLVVAELKSTRGRLSDNQQLWLDALKAVPDLEVYLWRPADWNSGAIEAVLRR